jgi:uncharacterized protein (TIGR02466 family)|tara:strand:- start:171 stop:800 length:630 start_codon:yes stop_codon:yes gene_type:complete
MSNAEIIGIFPTPIYLTKLKNNFSKEVLSFINNNKIDTQSKKSTLCGGNHISSNKYILEEEIFKDLKQELQLIVQDYFDKIICPFDNVTPYITQSWIIYNEFNQSHHEHCHSNSCVSGAVYIDCHETLDKICFVHHRYENIRSAGKANVFNADKYILSVKKNDVILFPSSLTHSVPKTEGHETRISLSFNTFIKGKIGDYTEASELILK